MFPSFRNRRAKLAPEGGRRAAWRNRPAIRYPGPPPWSARTAAPRVPRGAKACPECGSDEETGWADDADIDQGAADIPDAYDPDQWEEDAERDRVADGRKSIAVWLMILALGGFVVLALARFIFGRD